MGYAHSPHGNGRDDCEGDRAGRVVAYRVKTDGDGDDRGCADEGHVDQKANGKDEFKPGATEDASVVDNVEHVGVLAPVLDEIVGGVQAKHSHANDGDDAWEEPESVESGWQRQNANSNLIRYEDDDSLCGVEFLSVGTACGSFACILDVGNVA